MRSQREVRDVLSHREVRSHIGNVVVAPEARAQGVGRFLIDTMIRKALLEHRAEEVRISCFNGNVAGLLLYAKLGFVPFAVEPRLDQQGSRVALIHMRLAKESMESVRASRSADSTRNGG